MRTINKITILFTLFVAVFQVGAQEIIPEKEPVKKEPVQQGRKRIDGIIATVGDYNILDSDIDKSFLEMASQGVSIKDFTRCQMLGKLMEEKLFAHQATQDSVVVKDEEIKEKMNGQMEYMVEQLRSMEAVVKYFHKKDEDDLRSELYDVLKTQKLASEMQNKIVDGIQITPEETKNFFKKIQKTC